MGYLSLLQEIFPTQGLNLGPPHFRQILYHLSPRKAHEALVTFANCLYWGSFLWTEALLLPWSDSYITVTEALTLKRLGTLHLEPILFPMFIKSLFAHFLDQTWMIFLTGQLTSPGVCQSSYVVFSLPAKILQTELGELLGWWPVGPSTVRLLVVIGLASVRLTGEGGPLDNKVKQDVEGVSKIKKRD